VRTSAPENSATALANTGARRGRTTCSEYRRRALRKFGATTNGGYGHVVQRHVAFPHLDQIIDSLRVNQLVPYWGGANTTPSSSIPTGKGLEVNHATALLSNRVGGRVAGGVVRFGDHILTKLVPALEAGACVADAGKVCRCGTPTCISTDANGNTVWTYIDTYTLSCTGSCNFSGCHATCHVTV
jgi:hypothetical protein